MKPATKSWWWLAYSAFPLLAGLASLLVGRDVNWDLRNYHYYNAYAFLGHRWDIDIAPAQLQTFFNPLGDLPFYWLARNYPARVAGFVLGVMHGFNLSLLFSIFWRLSSHPRARTKALLGVCLVAMSALAPGFISELGNTMLDNFTSLFVLGAVLLLLWAQTTKEEGHSARSYLQIAGAGFLIGLGSGIKPSIPVFGVGAILAFSALKEPFPFRTRAAVLYIASASLGAAITAGFWWWALWTRLGNPFFPFLNDIFRSPYFTTIPIAWSGFLPANLMEMAIYPLLFSLDGGRVGPAPFRDIRFGLLFLLAIAWLVARILRRYRGPEQKPERLAGICFDAKAGNFVLLFFLISYLLWQGGSSLYRFLIPLELMVPLCFVLLADRLTGNARRTVAVSVGAALLTIALLRPIHGGRLPWTEEYFAVDSSRLSTSADAVVVMLGAAPTSYVIPHLPSNYRFVRIGGSLTAGDTNQLFLAQARQTLLLHSDAVYLLYNRDEARLPIGKVLRALWLWPRVSYCFTLEVNTMDNLEMCRLASPPAST
jgi:hypothetical protein